HEDLPSEMTPAFVQDRPEFGIAFLRKGRAEIAHGQTIAPANELAGECAEPRPPAVNPFVAHRTDRAGNGTIGDVLDSLEQTVFLPHRPATAATRSRTSASKMNSAGMGVMSVACSFTASFSVVTIASASFAAWRIRAMSPAL